MCQYRLRTIRKRRGFTLIELLVAMTIIVFLATLVAALLPSGTPSQVSDAG